MAVLSASFPDRDDAKKPHFPTETSDERTRALRPAWARLLAASLGTNLPYGQSYGFHAGLLKEDTGVPSAGEGEQRLDGPSLRL